jgi:hypothetical protein
MLPRNFGYHDRACDACGANAFTSLWQNFGKAATGNYVWDSRFNIVVFSVADFALFLHVLLMCSSWNFAQMRSWRSKRPKDFDIEKQLSLIDKYRRPIPPREMKNGLPFTLAELE